MDRLEELREQRRVWIEANRSADDPAPNWVWAMKHPNEADELYRLEEPESIFAHEWTPEEILAREG